MAKKRETYGSISRKLNALLEKQEQEKQRIARVMADELLTDQITLRIGDLTDTELRKVMKCLSEHLDGCIDQVENDNQASRSCIGKDTQGPLGHGPGILSDGQQISDTAFVQ